MERSFGVDFSKVRVHADADAASEARSMGALAFSRGEHVFFGHGAWRPGAPEGQAVLAHELTHVVQDRRARGVPAPGVAPASGPQEQEAHRIALLAYSQARAPLPGHMDGRGQPPSRAALYARAAALGGAPRSGWEVREGGDLRTHRCIPGCVPSSEEELEPGPDGAGPTEAPKEPPVPYAELAAMPEGFPQEFADHYSDIDSAVRAVNTLLKPTTPLDPDWLRAMMAEESNTGTSARRYDPLQTSNTGDHSLNVVRSGDENTHVITANLDPTLRTDLAGKATTPRGKKGWDYEGMDAAKRMDASTGIRLAVVWLVHHAAVIRRVEDAEAPIQKHTLKEGDNKSSLTTKLDTSPEVLEKLNPNARWWVGDVISWRSAPLQIAEWRTWEEATTRYNGGGNANYLAEVQAEYAAIKHARTQPPAAAKPSVPPE